MPEELQADDDYALRIRLPAHLPTSATSETAVKDAIIDQYVRQVSRQRCETDIRDPGCLLESEIAAWHKALDKRG